MSTGACPSALAASGPLCRLRVVAPLPPQSPAPLVRMMHRAFRPSLVGFALAAALGALACGSASAHPHLFVDARAEVGFDAEGRIVWLKNVWRFDEPFSAYAKQGLAHLPNGRLTAASLEALARVNIHSLATYRFFTFLKKAGKLEQLGDGGAQKLEDDGERLTLTFTVTPPAPIEVKGATTTVSLYDPEYFVAMSFVKDRPVRLVGAPPACRLQLFTPTGLTPEAAALIAQVPASQRTLPPDLQSMTGGIENGFVLDCTAH
ncbi:MAG: DUF1007 family protein [Ancalomicrobiaceae bacterium]|nr:DUF1007 family protein [Ancalomicrobiaceae bacterium]